VLQLVLRGDLSLGMHPEFRDPRRIQFAPGENVSADSVGLARENTINNALFREKKRLLLKWKRITIAATDSVAIL